MGRRQDGAWKPTEKRFAAIHRLLALIALAGLGTLISCGGGGAGSSEPTGTPTVTVTAPGTRIAAGNNTLQFTATVANASNPTVRWEVNGVPLGNSTVGTVSAAGLYTSPASPPGGGTVTVSAVLASDGITNGSLAIGVVTQPPIAGVFSWRNDLSISGVNSQETTLTPATVGGGNFGKISACPVDGYVYAQPLYVGGVSMPGLGLHNVLLVATEHDSVYAFDADAIPCQTLWQLSFLSNTQGITTVPSADVNSTDLVPEIGITSTPVVDPATLTMYLVAKTKLISRNVSYFLTLHALNITTGKETNAGPVPVQPSVPGTGVGSTVVGGVSTVSLEPLITNQRPGLQLANGYIYIASASHGDQGEYHGWLLAYKESTLSPASTPIAFNVSPNGSQGGIWQSGGAPSVDSGGYVYVASGNGTFDQLTEWGDTMMKISTSPSALSLSAANTFTPFNQMILDEDDLDLGTGGVLLLPDSAGTIAHPRMGVVVDKPAKVYIFDRDNPGGYTSGGPDNLVNTLTLSGRLYVTPLYWQGSLYVQSNGTALMAYPMATVAGGASPVTPTSQTPETFGFPGPTPALTANGTTGGVLWLLDTTGFSATGTASSAVLHAYDPTNLATELYSSSVRSLDAAGAAVKFTVPTVYNGKAYVGTQTEISIYGLLP